MGTSEDGPGSRSCSWKTTLLVSLFAWISPAHASEEITPRFIYSWKSLEAGRTAEAEAGLRAIHAEHPDHRPTSRLVAVLDRIAPPCPDPDLSAIRGRLAGSWKESRSAHFVLIHQHEEREAAARLALAERVLKTYYVWFTGLGFDLKPPDRRLVSIWFARRSDYVAFLESEGAGSFSDTHGHHSASADLVAIADERDDSGMADRTSDEGLKKARDIATLAHETVHHLVARSELERPGVEWPRWLQEGVAMLFESSENGDWAGVGGVNEHRIPLYRAIRPVPRLVATVRDVGFSPRYDADRYGSAWALVDYLAREHPRRFVSLLDRLRTPDSEPISPGDRAANAFREVFGDDWPHLEVSWHSAMRNRSRFPLNSARSERR